MNGNYSSSNSSTTSSTGKPNSSNKSTLSQSRNESPQSMETSSRKQDSAEKMPVKKLANKSTQVESPPGLKTISLSDSETCNSKVKQLPPSDYFRFPKSKATSSPVINMNSSSIPSVNNSPQRIISHTFLSAIDKDTLKKSGVTPELHPGTYEKSAKPAIEVNPLNFAHNQRTNVPMPSRFISTGSMLTEEMLLNGSLSRLRYVNPQNMHLLSEPNAWTNGHLNTTADCYINSPSRSKNFAPSVTQQKRR